jgi:hypothetical protein
LFCNSETPVYFLVDNKTLLQLPVITYLNTAFIVELFTSVVFVDKNTPLLGRKTETTLLSQNSRTSIN